METSVHTTRHRWQRRQHDTIIAFFSDCERGSRTRMDWLCSSDPSAPLVKGGGKKRQRPEAESGEVSAVVSAASLSAANGNGGKPAASDRNSIGSQRPNSIGSQRSIPRRPLRGQFFSICFLYPLFLYLATCQGLRPLLLLQQHPGLSHRAHVASSSPQRQGCGAIRGSKFLIFSKLGT